MSQELKEEIERLEKEISTKTGSEKTRLIYTIANKKFELKKLLAEGRNTT